MSSIESLQSIANDISTGFEILLERLDEQRRVEEDLRQQLANAVERFNSYSSDNPSDGALSAWQGEIVKQISQHPTDRVAVHDEIQEVETAKKAVAKLRSAMSPSPARRCPVAHIHPEVTDEMEKDFTVPGKPSNLECPFATTSKIASPDTTGQRDPIAAEFHQESLSAKSAEEARACGICPIRFLDKHSPEEIAQYFENHKHEIPRSHEICVKRYQRNENSIRQLDAKYGNLVSMIQGLGNKHKQYLPSEQPGTPEIADQKSTEVVEKWADHVGKEPGEEPVKDLPEERQSHFEKPLRDIRVGESPTRPWGISVPVDQPTAPSAIESLQGSKTSRKANVDTVSKQGATSIPLPTHTNVSVSQSYTSSRKAKSSRSPKIIFNGPVIMGYSAEEAAKFLTQLGLAKQG